MEKCSYCNDDSRDTPRNDASVVIVGNMNVGKTTLFSRLCAPDTASVDMSGTTVSITKGRIKGTGIVVYDTPGMNSIFSTNEDDKVSRNILLPRKYGSSRNVGLISGIILVADAKNIKRSIAIAMQYAEYGLPMLLDANMIDEAISRGVEIDYNGLADRLGIDILKTVAREGMGVRDIIPRLKNMRPPKRIIRYPEKVEQFLEIVQKLLRSPAISPRAVGLLLLTRDKAVETFISEHYGDGMLAQLKHLAEEYRQEETVETDIMLVNLYNKEADRIARIIQKIEPPSRNPFLVTFGDWCTRLATGIPIALVVLVSIYLFVGSFGATYLVDYFNEVFFKGFLIPLAERIVAPIPSVFIRDMIMDPDFGILPTGVFLAIGLVLPVIFCFYIAFGVLEDSGYLPRVSVLLDRVFKKMGLNGKGVIPLVMGFSCVTMAIMTTRILNTEKEKNIASFLLVLGMPCGPLIAVMLIILDKMPVSASVTVFGLILSQILIAGYILNKILPGERSPLLIEIPPMRLPVPVQVLKMALAKTYFFMKEAIPVFIVASLIVFLFERIGGLDLLEKIMGPVIGQVMGLPEKSIQVFLKTMIRRESGAAELEHISHLYTNLQLVVNLIVMTFVIPCLNACVVLFKERGGRTATAILVGVMIYAIIVGSAVNHACRMLGITFA